MFYMVFWSPDLPFEKFMLVWVGMPEGPHRSINGEGRVPDDATLASNEDLHDIFKKWKKSGCEVTCRHDRDGVQRQRKFPEPIK